MKQKLTKKNKKTKKNLTELKVEIENSNNNSWKHQYPAKYNG